MNFRTIASLRADYIESSPTNPCANLAPPFSNPLNFEDLVAFTSRLFQ